MRVWASSFPGGVTTQVAAASQKKARREAGKGSGRKRSDKEAPRLCFRDSANLA
jgi:hypothetical protein